MSELVGALITGAVLGSVIALAAAGLTLIYGVLRIATFAHGDVLTFGAYLGWALLGTAPWLGPAGGAIALGLCAFLVGARRIRVAPAIGLAAVGGLALVPLGSITGSIRAGGWWATLGGQIGSATLLLLVTAMPAVILMGTLGVATHHALWDPLKRRGAKAVMLMIASIGLAFFLRGVVTMVFGGDIQTYALPVTLPIRGPFDTTYTRYQAAAFLIAVSSIVALHLFLTRSTTGRMMRALADNPDLALVTGVDVPRLTRLTWAIGSGLAALAGVLYASLQALTPETGWALLLTLFAAVILGGIGSAQGAILAAVLIALAQEFTVVFTAGLDVPLLGPEYKVAVGFVILIVTLMFRPQGIMGVKTR